MGNIVWLASYPKSGNTWMRAFLHNLFRDPKQAMNINDMTGSLSQGESSNGWYRLIDSRKPEEWSAEDIARMRPRVHEMIAQSQPGSVFCKTHCALMSIRGYPTINMQVSAGAIYIIRNPLDVVISFADFQGVDITTAARMMATENFETPAGGSNVTEALGNWSQHVASWTAGGGEMVHVVRYEDLKKLPAKTFAGVTKFLQLDAPRGRIERAIKNSSFKVLRAQEDKFGFVERSPMQERFFRSGKSGEWRDVLTNDQVSMIVDTHREQMTRFGYVPEGY